MAVKQVQDMNVKILPDKYNVGRITGEQAVAFRPKNCFKLKFELVDEPIPATSEKKDLDTEEPLGERLDTLVDKFPAPSEWHDE